jgi:hypothetical protein
MQKFVIIKMTEPGDIITAGKFDRGFYVFNLAPFNGFGGDDRVPAYNSARCL